jgi:hypothetical protein
MKATARKRAGQSVLEYVVLLALIFIIVFTVVHGVGQSTGNRVAQANEGLEEQKIAAQTAVKPAVAKPAVAASPASPISQPAP